jgi:hypothetical protein
MTERSGGQVVRSGRMDFLLRKPRWYTRRCHARPHDPSCTIPPESTLRIMSLPPRRQWVLATVALTLVLTAIHLPLLIDRASPIWDAFDTFGPYAMLVGDFARQGQLLLWNPFVFAGSPDYLEPQIGAFSPLILITGLLVGGSRHGFELYCWWFGGAGVLVLARSLGAFPV